MSSPLCHSPLFALLRRLLAAGSVAMVLALSILAASPDLHGKLHKAPTASGDDECAVVLFANGVSLPFAAIAAEPPAFERRAEPAVSGEEIFLASPRYLRQPERGPPALG